MSESLETAPAALQTATALEIRDELQRMVLGDLVGPSGGDHEEIDEPSVSERYLCAMLAPLHRRHWRVEVDAEAFNGVDTTKEDGPAETDQPETDTRTIFPCTFGFTCTLPAAHSNLRVVASWGAYERKHSETAKKPDGEPKMVWKRTPREGARLVDLVEGDLQAWQPDAQNAPDVWVEGRARKRDWGGGDHWLVTLFLRNNGYEPEDSADSSWLFQARLRAESPDDTPIFTSHPIALDGAKDDSQSWDERRQLAMMHRHCAQFAVGHNVSVHAECDAEDSRRARAVETTCLPSHEVERQDPPTTADIPELAALVLSMNDLAELPDAEIVAGLRPLVSAYGDWIGARWQETENDASLAHFEETASAALKKCERAKERIAEGIALLERDASAMLAFRFANRTMSAQRVRSIWIEAQRSDENAQLADFDIGKNRAWRPFQLAFILLNLPALADVKHFDRSASVQAAADLLWFPTGGGKTEAYLGLTAFTLAIRRLQGTVGGRDGMHGVAVLMRYTLRLLTLQQFQRAAALICACEIERRGNVRLWGDEPFRLGLWVGAKTTPNKTKDAAESIKNLKNNAFGGGATPLQFTNCPWCGASIDAGRDVKVDADRARTLLFCPNFAGNCAFTAKNSDGEGVPAIVVDEEIYRRLPSLVIATVDKFAQMPWNGLTSMLFGHVNGRCPRHGFLSPEVVDSPTHPAKGALPATRSVAHGPLRPPDLIIQDELHLISGPLGTLVGLYETAVDQLCSWTVDGQTVRPKVVASTATVRNARRQMKALFLREVEVFPPPALDARDNFFSRRTASTDRAPSRLYIGVCAPGKRLKSALIRVYLAYMGGAQSLYLKYGAGADQYPGADPYLTTIGYFSSMRELGGMRRLIDDDVSSRLKRLDRRGLAKREIRQVEELTSRKNATDIPVMLDKLNATFDPKAAEGRKADAKAGKRFKTNAPLDVCLATNMISVGVDVPRLGLMIVGGQPKSTSEYIQATSRVGRQKPGVVCTVFNWARPRDLNHYETFEHYHATFYQHVEALSVTPFAPRALDRGLSALLVSLVRLENESLNANDRAHAMQPLDQSVQNALNTIAQRAGDVEENNAARADVETALKARLDSWQARIAAQSKSGVPLGYQTSGSLSGLLDKPGGGAWNDFTCLNSLRDVEAMSSLMLQEGGMDDAPE